jgi:hypothetical protein
MRGDNWRAVSAPVDLKDVVGVVVATDHRGRVMRLDARRRRLHGAALARLSRFVAEAVAVARRLKYRRASVQRWAHPA